MQVLGIVGAAYFPHALDFECSSFAQQNSTCIFSSKHVVSCGISACKVHLSVAECKLAGIILFTSSEVKLSPSSDLKRETHKAEVSS